MCFTNKSTSLKQDYFCLIQSSSLSKKSVSKTSDYYLLTVFFIYYSTFYKNGSHTVVEAGTSNG